MKIGEARQVYSAQLNGLRERQRTLLKQQEELKNHQNSDPKVCEGVTLELSTLEKQIDQTQNFMDNLLAMSTGIHNAEVSRQQGEVLAEYAEDVSKCLEVARRISKGGKVPPSDEKRLMDYSFELYMAAKNAAVMNTDHSHKKYKSLWEDEEEKGQEDRPLASEVADNTEVHMELPEVVDIPEES